MSELRAAEFSDFFRAVHGCDPFPWQKRLALKVVERGAWPALLDLPTGAGKTAAIDIAVFHLACEADQGRQRRAPVRILFVVDRRIVVDEAFRRACKIAAALRTAQEQILIRVKRALERLSGEEGRPLEVTRLRGGVPRERDWARSPCQPLVAVSTVDQVGSRLLFRGYGVSPRMLPVHAGLVGSDALWLLDEVHLSQPLAETLQAIERAHQRSPYEGRLAPFAVVQLSATPGGEDKEAFRLSHDDRAHPDLRRRLGARKRAKLVFAPEDADTPASLAELFCQEALRLAGLVTGEPAAGSGPGARAAEEAMPPVHRVAVVVNRVGLARQVFERLRQLVGEGEEATAQVVLLTGRLRPLDRDQLLRELLPLFAAPCRPAPERPIILVATQTIEVGADLDVDALVTEVAPIDALRQRFGRLDRLGLRGESQAVIVMPKVCRAWEQGPWRSVTLIYGEAARNTAELLACRMDEVGFGIDEAQEWQDKVGPHHLAPRAHAPTLLPPYADLWAMTSPPAAATPEPSLFLHGPDVAADVQVVWRAGIKVDDSKSVEAAVRWLDVCPPSALEALPAPLWAVQRWLGGMEADYADVPQRAEFESTKQSRRCLRWDGQQWAAAVARELRPGDTVVVPSSYGGCDRYGWNPASREPVPDLGPEAHYRQRLRGALLITRETLALALEGQEEVSREEAWAAVARTLEDIGEEEAEEWIDHLLEIRELPELWRQLLQGMRTARPRSELLEPENPAKGAMVWAAGRLPRGLLAREEEGEEAYGEEPATADEFSWVPAGEVGLEDHLQRVGERARKFAQQLGLSDDVAEAVSLAARLHDTGKADPRFQLDLRGEGALPAWVARFLGRNAGRLLAKPAVPIGGRRAVPEGFRHEALSVALAATHPALAALREEQRDLVLWLIGTHHGYGRPFFPPCRDPAPETATKVVLDGAPLEARAHDAPLRLDQGWFERAARLWRRFGPWELARLEAIVRLADHLVSAEEQEGSSR